MKRFPLTMLTAALALVPLLGHAQAFPEKPITFVVPFAAGSATDQLERARSLEWVRRAMGNDHPERSASHV